MEQTRTLQGELTVTLFADQIRWMEQTGMAIWKTPGSSSVYMHDHDDYAELHIWI